MVTPFRVSGASGVPWMMANHFRSFFHWKVGMDHSLQGQPVPVISRAIMESVGKRRPSYS